MSVATGGVHARDAGVVDTGEERRLAVEGGQHAGIVGALGVGALERVRLFAAPDQVHGGECAPAELVLDGQAGQVLVHHWHPLRN